MQEKIVHIFNQKRENLNWKHKCEKIQPKDLTTRFYSYGHIDLLFLQKELDFKN